ncbi:MAG: DUF1801 domain-containing protein [Flavobacterium sp.]|jgi:hypothetical protein|uniref:DUF1801 domain-containing protein n=1 Tax=Flavobacterium sp. TaxID=239 RepID=UPI0022C7AD80|nr:DUF1801 domain-containing protein [Flavobacterium sp.]MCZ8167873.1 DUF1801 domain-containing protein [Flavobacterium sp.]MCZ8297045.1 DUF1801 domain-containing protein [Flavobacterium sp.]
MTPIDTQHHLNHRQPMSRSLDTKFTRVLELKNPNLVKTFHDLREFVLNIYPDSNELRYHTHALTIVFSLSDKLSDAFCMIPVYSNHLNLGFNKGTLLKDEKKRLTGTGKLIRHIPIQNENDYRNTDVEQLILSAVELALKEQVIPSKIVGKVISKIK